jgi:hypothetical protein
MVERSSTRFCESLLHSFWGRLVGFGFGFAFIRKFFVFSVSMFVHFCSLRTTC